MRCLHVRGRARASAALKGLAREERKNVMRGCSRRVTLVTLSRYSTVTRVCARERPNAFEASQASPAYGGAQDCRDRLDMVAPFGVGWASNNC